MFINVEAQCPYCKKSEIYECDVREFQHELTCQNIIVICINEDCQQNFGVFPTITITAETATVNMNKPFNM